MMKELLLLLLLLLLLSEHISRDPESKGSGAYFLY
jgi:hypothetical protein